ncbi:hypothetical protein E3T61_17155 [Cryobacterium lactosi]|uniref:Uncharacterized protein n=1 Tax=Cryobacterium lactosi TaxID=1259202 RepID=A0A4V3IWL2_9MICO|nr:hypothetical protein [Cryobacterium lactosi]TFD85852.1 hypothetical protein E3T61_17155 [Cryobacterium lactosi]
MLGLAVALAAVVTGIVAFAKHRTRLRIPRSGVGVARDPLASRTLDGALDGLTLLLGRSGRTRPGIVLVTIDTESIRLRLSTPCPNPPAPWCATANDTIWSRPAAGIRPSPPATPGSHGITGMVTVSNANGVVTLLDLSEARGLVFLEGDRPDLVRLAEGWVDDFIRNPWSYGLPVLLVGRDEGPSGGPVSATTAAELLETVTRGGAGLAVVDEPLTGQVSVGLRRALESPDCRWAVVSIAGAEGARWRFTVQADGSMTSEVFPADQPTALHDGSARAL